MARRNFAATGMVVNEQSINDHALAIQTVGFERNIARF
jgi:hypothetical protein